MKYNSNYSKCQVKKSKNLNILVMFHHVVHRPDNEEDSDSQSSLFDSSDSDSFQDSEEDSDDSYLITSGD
jgi:hypothetical protein